MLSEAFRRFLDANVILKKTVDHFRMMAYAVVIISLLVTFSMKVAS